MASLQGLVISSSASADSFKSDCNLAPSGLDAANNFVDYLTGLIGGALPGASLAFNVGMAKAAGSITQTSTGAANGETLTVCGVTFTARTSGATGNEWDRDNDVSVSATNLAASINASTDTNIYVSAVAVAGVVTITMLKPGVIGNVPTITESCSNTTCVTFAGGSEGTAYTIDLD